MKNPQTVHNGQKIYNKLVLKFYDLWVLGFSNTYLWKCKTKLLKKNFNKFISNNHLDVGVGTGYFLNKCLKENTKRVCLFDLNENSLNQTKNSIKRFNVTTYKVNVLEKINVKCEKFDSISINYLLHCLPGSLNEKSICFSYLNKYLNDNAVIFGSTILAKNTNKNFFAKKLMSIYNKKGIFSNTNDSIEDLESSLKKYFTNVKIELIGTVAIFSAVKK